MADASKNIVEDESVDVLSLTNHRHLVVPTDNVVIGYSLRPLTCITTT